MGTLEIGPCWIPRIKKSWNISAEKCGLPLVKGACKKFLPKYGFNTATSRCEKFIYGGCGGNDNKFNTLEECVNLCGGLEPEESLACEATKCNTQEAMVYRAKGCQPVLKKGEVGFFQKDVLHIVLL